MSYFCCAIAISMKRFSIYTLLTLLAVSCTSSFTEVENGSDMIEVFFGQSTTIGSRTSIADDGAASWSKTDKIALWAAKSDGTFALANQTFSLHHYSTTYDRAVFSSKIPNTLTEQSYTYYATYPVPKSVDGNIARFNLPATQNGSRELGSRDIMVARPETGAALVEDEYLNLDLSFTHKMHTLRLQLQDTQLNGVDIDEIMIIFPNDIVGDVLVDITDPNATPVLLNSSSYINIRVPEDYKAGDYLWATIFPTTFAGDITYRVKAGNYTSRTHTISLNKEAKPQRVTPMSMPIPEVVTTVYIAVEDNYLGEDYQTITIYNNDSVIGSFERNETQEYYIDESFNIPIGQFLNLSIQFESANAIVTTNVTSSSQMVSGATHRIPTNVPYLLFEDFSSISEGESYGNNDYAYSDREQPGNALDGIGLTGWNAARYWAKTGSIRINYRYQKAVGFGSAHHGRLDTPPLSCLKNNVNVLITFDTGAYHHSESSMTINASYISLATHTNSTNPIDGIPTGKSGMFSNYSTTIADFGTTHYKSSSLGNNLSDDAFSSAFPTQVSTTISVTPSTRFCFYPSADTSGGTAGTGNAEVNIYLDNIKVKIVQ